MGKYVFVMQLCQHVPEKQQLSERSTLLTENGVRNENKVALVIACSGYL